MADSPIVKLAFAESCGDCGYREVTLPEKLPALGDDFDWLLRDYDGFRLFMMEQLAARFPERRAWAPADMEVVIVEALAVVLDQLSDQLDRVFAEAFLESARRPESVRRLLSLIGYDALAEAEEGASIPDPTPTVGETEAATRARVAAFHIGLLRYLGDYPLIYDQLTAVQQTGVQNFLDHPLAADAADLDAVQELLDRAPDMVARIRQDALHSYWALNPRAMNLARAAGPRAIHTQRRMVTASDYALRLAEHPLVLYAQSYARWTGSWSSTFVTGLFFNRLALDEEAAGATSEETDWLCNSVDDFHRKRELEEIDWAQSPTVRTVLRHYVAAYRMAGQEVFLRDADIVGINISLSLRIAPNYYQSEVRRAVLATLGTRLGGYFEAGNLAFGEDLYASDLVEVVMALEGVEAVCLNRFKRVGKRFANQADGGRIELQGFEVAVCDNLPGQPERGALSLSLHGGRRG
jgi:hypothetical protein